MKKSEMRELGWAIQSGDQSDTETACYNCGTPLRVGATTNNAVGDCIVCVECGGRCGYIEQV